MKKGISEHLSNKKVLFILNKETGLAPYSHEFVPDGIDPQILSGFVSAMTSFMNEVTGEEQSGWTTVYGSDSTFIVQEGDWTIGVIAVSRETSEIRSKLRSVVREFEDTFQSLKEAEGIDGKIFNEFDQYVMRVFIAGDIVNRTIVIKDNHYRKKMVPFDLPSKSYQVMKFLSEIGNGESIANISQRLNLPIKKVTELVCDARWHNAIYLHYIPDDEDILELSHQSHSKLLSNANPLKIADSTRIVLSFLDGRTPLKKLMSHIDELNHSQMLYELGILILSGFVERIPIEKQLVLLVECVASRVFRQIASDIGVKKTRAYFTKAIKQIVNTQPWIGRIRQIGSRAITYDFVDSMAPSDLDQLYEAIESLIDTLLELVTPHLKKKESSRILSDSRKYCNKIWASRLRRYMF